MEIERKFLVKSLPENIESCSHVEMQQGYLATSPTLRVRRAGDKYILTVKEHLSNEGAIVNREEEFMMAKESYEELLSKCDGRIVTKRRYIVPLEGGLKAELDVFDGRHQGLMMVEVEFPNLDMAGNFVPPSWFGEDVSSDPRYRNAYLATH